MSMPEQSSCSALVLLASNDIGLVGDVLLRVNQRDDEAEYNSNALLHVSDPNRFTIRLQLASVSFKCWAECDGSVLLMGIAPRDADVTSRDISEHTGVFMSLTFTNDGECVIYHARNENSVLALPGYQSCKRTNTPLLMQYENRQLWFAFEGHARAEVSGPIPPGDYRPCISVFDLSLRHRAVLSATSPFFESAFEGKMQESKSAKVVLEDAEPDSVQAMLAYMYTGDVGDRVNARALLQVAHRLEVSGLVAHCASMLSERVNEQSVLETVRALRPYCDDPTVKPHWDTVVGRIMSQEPLVRMVMANLRA